MLSAHSSVVARAVTKCVAVLASSLPGSPWLLCFLEGKVERGKSSLAFTQIMISAACLS